MNYYLALYPIYKRATKKMCLDCQNFIEKGTKILDLGCGAGIAAKDFQDFFQAKVIGVDVKDQRIFHIPFEIIDGKNLPFPDKSFDTVLISYVLHHAEDPNALLMEAKRVCRDKIVIFEDLPEGFISGIICKIHGIFFDKIFGNPSKTSFKKEEDWRRIFNELELNIIFKKRRHNFPVKKELFILGV
jgi:SAM-dependent methyltransferase